MNSPPLKLMRGRRYRPPSRDWRRLTVTGWQHGAVPEPPEGLGEKRRAAWRSWFASWVAAYWSPSDAPNLRIVILSVEHAHRIGATKRDRREAVAWMTSYGLTAKGRRYLRWLPPLTALHKPADPEGA
jgi:hypothetical protein